MPPHGEGLERDPESVYEDDDRKKKFLFSFFQI
jgi:hypothetical protein